MSQIDYELVYKLRRFRTNSLQNLIIRYENKARDEAVKEFDKYANAIKAAIGTDDFEVTNVACLADGIVGHVYTPGSGPKGAGKRKCIYCGCDDFDD